MPVAATLDVITIGRSSVDLYGQQIGGRLEDMATFAKSVGGSPTNTAVGAALLSPSRAAPIAVLVGLPPTDLANVAMSSRRPPICWP